MLLFILLREVILKLRFIVGKRLVNSMCFLGIFLYIDNDLRIENYL